MTSPRRSSRASRTTWTLALALAFPAAVARAQEPAVPTAEALQRFEARLEALESENRALRDTVRELMEAQIPAPSGSAGANGAAGAVRGPGAPDEEVGMDEPGGGPAAGASTAADSGGPTGTSGAPSEVVGMDEPAPQPSDVPKRVPLKAWLDRGFVLSSDDDEYQLQFHNETQVEYRAFDHTGQHVGSASVHNGFFIPRQIWTFSGRFTKRVEYLASFQRGLGSFELRDAMVNFDALDEGRLIIRAGRFRTPFSYEYHALSNVELISPERSVFNLNFSNLRAIGAMAWGELGDDRIDYAAAILNNSRNGYENVIDQPSFAGFLNFRPFRHSERFPYLHYLNFGASTDVSGRFDGDANGGATPLALRTSTNASLSSGASTASPAFLAFNQGVRENGPKTLGGAHVAWFRNRLSLLAEYDFGAENYIPTPVARIYDRVAVPIQAYYVQAGFFLTGEHMTHRGPVDVKRPFNLKPGKDFGLGAVELGARYASLRLGNEVFSGGLADPGLWTNHVQVVDVGFNWYLNRYLKIYLDWQNSQFGSPVSYGPGRFVDTTNLYWARLQLLF